MKKLTLYSKGLVPLGFHGTDTCLYQVPGRYIELWRGILALEDISPLLQLKVSTSDMNATILASQY